MKKIFSIIFIVLSVAVSAQKNFRTWKLKISDDNYSVMAPVIYKSGIVYSSNQPNAMISVAGDGTIGSGSYNLYYIEKKGRKWNDWGKPELFDQNIKSYLNESSACFSENMQQMFFTQSYNANLSLSKLQKMDSIKNGIFEASLTDKDWLLTRQFAYNEEDYNFAFPYLSSDESMLFFCSDKPGGYGGYDIYVCKLENGRWVEPENLGSRINTKENDVSPFYHSSGRLYFSSRGHHVRTDLEIYYSEIIEGEWIRPVALTKPFNRINRDDFGYVLAAEMDTGYYVASNRQGTDDIWMFASSFPAFKECPKQMDETFCYEFSETGSLDLDTTSLKYEWDFGDGYKRRNIVAEHCFQEGGLYQVSLNVIDTLTGDVYFSEASYELLVEPLEQAYIFAPDTVLLNTQVTLHGKNSSISSFEPIEYFWDLGDGNVENGMEIEYTYTKPGRYYIRLGVTSGDDEDGDYSRRTCSQREIIVLDEQGNNL